MSNQIKFEVETKRILEILSSQIYDSPLALLRENVQNAYDAILMRCEQEGIPSSEGKIKISLNGSVLKIEDNGIGMTEEVLRGNFWKAGSSGKHTKLAADAGVIGTFGIGAMANFGVATYLEITTSSRESSVTLRSTAKRDELSISEECISLEIIKDNREPGTEILIHIDNPDKIGDFASLNYLRTYVEYLPIEIKFNNLLISQKDLDTSEPFQTQGLRDFGAVSISDNLFAANVHIGVNPQGLVRTEVTDIKLKKIPIIGSLLLSQGGGQIMGYRNFFGLAPIPVSTYFQLGGLANLSFLTPTAGREALSRESITLIQSFVNLIEKTIAEKLATTEFADRSPVFQNYISSHNRYDLAGTIKVDVRPERESIALNDIIKHCEGRKLQYYLSHDQATMNLFSSPEIALLHPSQSNPRRQIQINYIKNILKIAQIPDQVSITKEYSGSELSLPEIALAIRIASTLAEDYFLKMVDIKFVDITHGVQFSVNGTQDNLIVNIARNCPPIAPLLECYDSAREVFSDFVKDFVRNQLYPHVQNYVPSSSKIGAETLRNILRKNREIYSYEESDLGELEPILADILSGKKSLGSGIKSARNIVQAQKQTVTRAQVGNVETAIPDVVSSPVKAGAELNENTPRPAILREDVECKYKILATEQNYPQLNGFRLFLGLSDKLFKRESIFFKSPHTTRAIWAGHRVIYVFNDPTGSVMLYYDIELQEPLSDDLASGKMIPSTTLILKNRLFVPIPKELESAFQITEGSRRFVVNFDTIP